MMLFLLPNLSHARLKDYVPIIKVKYHQKTKDTFNNIATYFEKRGDPQAAEFFRSYAERGSWGSGFIVVDKSGNNYIITNRHVVEQSENVDVVFENEDGSENFIVFSARIPLFNEKGRPIDARSFLKGLRSKLKKEPFNLNGKLYQRGLGEAWLIIGAK